MKRVYITNEVIIYPEMGKPVGTVRWDGSDLPEKRGDLIVAPIVGSPLEGGGCGGFVFYGTGFIAAKGDHMVFAVYKAPRWGAQWEAYNEGAALRLDQHNFDLTHEAPSSLVDFLEKFSH